MCASPNVMAACYGLRARPDTSPDNDDSAFSDNASLVSSSSGSASAPIAGGTANKAQRDPGQNKPCCPSPLVVAVFFSDGSTQPLTVGGDTTASSARDVLVERSHVQFEPSWGIVEHVHELHMERCLEEHEGVLSVIRAWKPDSKNRILFVPRPERFDLFRRPERYLTEVMPAEKWDPAQRQELLTNYFSEPWRYPAVEGSIWIRADSKKSWKKQHLVLTESGLYIGPAPTKTKTDSELTCLTTSLDALEVYFGVGWRKKHKAPTDFCFALKPAQCQDKTQLRLARLMCVESEALMLKWVTALRLAKDRRRGLLLDGYNSVLCKMQTGRAGNDLIYEQLGSRQQQQQHHSDKDISRPSGPSLKPNNESWLSMNSTTSSASSSTASVSSGCVSETSSIVSETGFDAEFPEGGTIKRKPNGAPAPMATSAQPRHDVIMSPVTSPPPKPPMLSSEAGQLMGSDLSLNAMLPPPPPEDLRCTATLAVKHGYYGRFPDPAVVGVSQVPLGPGPQGFMPSGVANVGVLQPGPSIALSPPSGPIPSLPSNGVPHIGPVPFNPQSIPLQLPAPSCCSSGSDAYMSRQMYCAEPPAAAIREQLYPCGVFRAVFPKPEAAAANSQMDLLKSLPNTVSPLLAMTNNPTAVAKKINGGQKKRITFNEVVHLVDEGVTAALKCASDTASAKSVSAASFPACSVRNPAPGRLFEPASAAAKSTPPREFLSDLQRVMRKKWAVAQRFHFPHASNNAASAATSKEAQAEATERFANHVKEQDVSNWILQSLKHSHIRETDMSLDLCQISAAANAADVALGIKHEMRPKIYNGRSVPNCFPPANPNGGDAGLGRWLADSQRMPAASADNKLPPAPPRRSQTTQLTSPR